MRFFWSLCVGVPLLLGGTGPAKAEPGAISGLIPAASPVVLVVHDPGGFTEDLRGFIRTGAEEPAPSPDGSLGELFRLIGFEGIPEGVDVNGRLAVAVPQFPFPLFIVPVNDYSLFLESLRKHAPPSSKGTPTPAPAGEGIDRVVIGGKDLFARKEGGFALLSPLPLLLTTPAQGTGLAGVLDGEERAMLAGNSLFLRLEVGFLIALIEPFLTQTMSRVSGTVPAGPSQDPPPSPDQKRAEAARLLQAEFDLLMKGLRQVRSISTAGSVGERGLSLSTLTIPLPDTGFATLLRQLKPGPHRFLDYFDSEAAMAGAMRFDAAAKDMVTAITTFVIDAGISSLPEADRKLWESLTQAWLEVAGTNSAYYLGPSTSGGAFSTLFISEVTHVERARSAMTESLGLAENFISPSPELPEMKVSMTTASEEYRDLVIDHFRFDLDLPEEEKEREKFYEAMEVLFGGRSLDLWVTFFDGLMVASYYTSSPDDLKNLCDRLRDKRPGGLSESTSFRHATEGFPSETNSVAFFSFPRFVALILDMVKKVQPESALPPWPLEEGASSGVGVAYLSTGGALKVDTFVPRRHARDIRLLTEYLKSLPSTAPPGKNGATD